MKNPDKGSLKNGFDSSTDEIQLLYGLPSDILPTAKMDLDAIHVAMITDIILRLLRRRANKRITWNALQQHPLFTKDPCKFIVESKQLEEQIMLDGEAEEDMRQNYGSKHYMNVPNSHRRSSTVGGGGTLTTNKRSTERARGGNHNRHDTANNLPMYRSPAAAFPLQDHNGRGCGSRYLGRHGEHYLPSDRSSYPNHTNTPPAHGRELPWWGMEDVTGATEGAQYTRSTPDQSNVPSMGAYRTTDDHHGDMSNLNGYYTNYEFRCGNGQQIQRSGYHPHHLSSGGSQYQPPQQCMIIDPAWTNNNGLDYQIIDENRRGEPNLVQHYHADLQQYVPTQQHNIMAGHDNESDYSIQS